MKYQLPRIHRDPNAAAMVGKKTGAFKDQRNGRGGSKNEEQQYREEYEEASSEPVTCFCGRLMRHCTPENCKVDEDF